MAEVGTAELEEVKDQDNLGPDEVGAGPEHDVGEVEEVEAKAVSGWSVRGREWADIGCEDLQDKVRSHGARGPNPRFVAGE